MLRPIRLIHPTGELAARGDGRSACRLMMVSQEGNVARMVTSGGEIRDHPTADINSPDGITAGAVATTTDLTNQRSGLACFSCAGTAASTSFRQFSFTAPALGAQIYPRTYFNVVDTLPTATAKVAALTTAAGGALISARLTPAGALQLWNDAAGTQIGGDSTTVVA